MALVSGSLELLRLIDELGVSMEEAEEIRDLNRDVRGRSFLGDVHERPSLGWFDYVLGEYGSDLSMMLGGSIGAAAAFAGAKRGRSSSDYPHKKQRVSAPDPSDQLGDQVDMDDQKENIDSMSKHAIHSTHVTPSYRKPINRRTDSLYRPNGMRGPTNEFVETTTKVLTCAENKSIYWSSILGDKTTLTSLYGKQYYMNESAATSFMTGLGDAEKGDNIFMQYKFKQYVRVNNNYGYSAKLTAYYLMVKDGTSSLPETLVQDGISNKYGVNVSTAGTSVQNTAEDSLVLFENYHVYKKLEVTLPPGGSTTFKQEKKRFVNYNKQDAQHTGSSDEYEPKYTQVLLFRLQGLPGHVYNANPALTTVGYSPAFLDMIVDKVYIFRFQNMILLRSNSLIQTGLGAASQQTHDHQVEKHGDADVTLD